MASPTRSPRRKPRYRAAIRRGWIHEQPSEQLHAILGRFHNDRMNLDLSERQEWLWDQVLKELQARWKATGPLDRCHCMFCMPDDSWMP